jgi:hypothetical protein
VVDPLRPPSIQNEVINAATEHIKVVFGSPIIRPNKYRNLN